VRNNLNEFLSPLDWGRPALILVQTEVLLDLDWLPCAS
jgi:hypothetical protein